MSVGKGNRPVDYTINDTTLGRSYSVRDLEVQVSDDLFAPQRIVYYSVAESALCNTVF